LADEGRQILGNTLGDQVVVEGRERFSDLIQGEAGRKRIVTGTPGGGGLERRGRPILQRVFWIEHVIPPTFVIRLRTELCDRKINVGNSASVARRGNKRAGMRQKRSGGR
jgi:hypothetical protein